MRDRLVLALIGSSAIALPAAGQSDGGDWDIRNHEPFNIMVVNHTLRSVMMVNSVIGYIMNDQYLPFEHYGITGVPGDATQVLRSIWVTDTTNRKIHRFAGTPEWPPLLHGTIDVPMDQLGGMEYVEDAKTIYVANRGTNFAAPGDGILMFDITGQPKGFFEAVDPRDVFYSPDLNELLVSSGKDDAIDRYSLEGAYLGRLVDSNGISGIDQPGQLAHNHHSGEVIAAGTLSPAGLYYYDVNGEELAFYPQAGNVVGIGELENELEHGLLIFGSNLGLYTYWAHNDELTTIRAGQSMGHINMLQFFCWADYDRSDFVDTDDYTAFVLDFELGVPEADFDGSGFVDSEDFANFVQRFIEGC
jgi:hypothetical protein